MSTRCPQNAAGYPHVTSVIHRPMHNTSTINPQVTWGNSENTGSGVPEVYSRATAAPRDAAAARRWPADMPGSIPARAPARRRSLHHHGPRTCYFRRGPVNTIARCCATTYHGHMTTWQPPKRAGYFNPVSQLEAALIGGVVAG